MNPIFRNIIAVLAGVIIGGSLNMGIIMISGSIIALPEGADVSTPEGLKATMHLFQPKNFIMPFLAHALGTLVGAFIAYKIGVSHNLKLALAVGAFFLLGGITNVMMLPSPMWFNILDIVGAYLPMAYIGGILARKKI